MPISLDTFKYFTDERFMLISEYLRIQDQDKNRITFTISRNESLFRVFIENTHIYMTLKTEGRTIVSYSANEIVQKLDIGTYWLDFEFSTEAAKKKAVAYKSAFHLTILLTDGEYFRKSYVAAQGDALTGCTTGNANFPLGLTRQPSK